MSSTQLQFRCPKCIKKVEVVSRMPFGKEVFINLSCGHATTESNLEAFKDVTNIDWNKLEDGRELFPFQALTRENMIKCNGRCLLALNTGLGKTICSVAFIRQLFEETKDVLIVTKKKLMLQWFEEFFKGAGFNFAAAIIENKNQRFLPGFINIINYDLFIHIKDHEQFKAKTLILDECQLIANPSAGRTKAIRAIAQNAKYVIALSGTPFKNNVHEYFTILNILRPDLHSNYAAFIRRWCKVIKKGNTHAVEGLINPEAFLEYNKDFVFYFDREQVLPDLPKVFRQYKYVELDKLLTDAYDKQLEQFTAFYDKATEFGSKGVSFQDQANLLAFLVKMKHLAGLAKVSAIEDYVEEFLEQTDRKLAIFIHHQDVDRILTQRLNKVIENYNILVEMNGLKGKKVNNVLNFRAGLDIYEAEDLKNKFREDESNRIAVLSTLSNAEGLNFQFMSDCIIGERQWNPANEEQVEGRFPRPGSTADKINAIYPVAVNTIDEMLAELVEKKRQWVKEALTGETVSWDESSIIKELASMLAAKGRKRWGSK